MVTGKKGFFSLLSEKFSQLTDCELMLAYDGDVTHQVMKAFTSLVEERLDSEGEDEMVIRRVYHILVECLQNINRHAESDADSGEIVPGRGGLFVGRTAEYYRVSTINLIQGDQESRLKEFLNRINPMSEADLSNMYKEQLKNGTISVKGGAGLGFIDIRRKTGNPLDFEFIKDSEEKIFFLLNVFISR